MRLTITGKNIELTDGLKTAVEERLAKLDKYFNDDTSCKVTLSVEKDRQKAEATIFMKKHTVRSEQVSNDMYISIDKVEDTIEKQLKKYRDKMITRKQDNLNSFKQAFLDLQLNEEDSKINIVRTKKFGLKPMYAEDACLQMELLGHGFFVFKNADTDEVNVVYKRKGNTYGLIEPEEF